MWLKQVVSQGRACGGYLENRTLLETRTIWEGFLEEMVYEGTGGSLIDPGAQPVLGALFIYLFFNIYLFIWLHRVLVAAPRIFSCGMQDI